MKDKDQMGRGGGDELSKHNLVIITHSVFGGNFGGILQAYAMQRVLRRMGYEVATDAPIKDRINSRDRVIPVIKILLKYTVKPSIVLTTPRDVLRITASEPSKFAIDNMELVDLLKGRKKPRRSSLKGIQGYIVGSDQVWRKRYCDVSYNLLSFISDREDLVKVSYAASFGKDNLSEYGSKLIGKTSRLAKKFDAISVREQSGVDICKKNWGVHAEQLVDPTLLLSKVDYENLVRKHPEQTYASDGDLFAYVLDRKQGKGEIIDTIARKRKLTTFEIMPKAYSTRQVFNKDILGHMLPPVPQWVRSFMDAEFVVTDSFHGCVFSIIFNKPFIAIGNEFRGLARFTSLLSLFGLEQRLVLSADDISLELINEKIDWDKVNNKIKSEQKRSFDYLKKYLG